MSMSRIIKRVFDVVAALAGLVVLAPLLAIVAAAIRLTMGRPVLFRQVRPGYAGRPFTLVKFRTMREASGPDGRPLADAERLTRLGRFLRATSLDELPQLWNVLTGELSLVGPRPLLTRYLPYYTERERLRLTVRPGITGWAQVRGRNHAPWDQRLGDDAWYVENWSLGLDLLILLKTVQIVLLGRGVVVAPTEAMRDLDEERTGLAQRSHRPEPQP
jgi:sugar transferase EpsL